MNYVYHLDQPEAANPALTGGKGANLARLAAAGFPVPAGFVVSAEAYRVFAGDSPLVARHLAAFAYADHAQLARQCTALRMDLEQQPLPAEVEQAILEALARFPVGQAWSVRSSSTYEDLAAAAFAGQHDTFLNVRGVDDVLAHAKACWLSLWGERAVLYRHQHGFGQHDVHMAVVVQQLIPCAVAGVAFSINPVSGCMDEMIVDANLGLGESVVSGEAAVDHWVLDRTTLQVREAVIARKHVAVVPGACGTEEHELDAAVAEAPSLSPAQLAELGALVKQVATAYAWPQDVEWGLYQDRFYLLQSRPITVIPPRWTRDESAERFPNPMTPLVWEFLEEGFADALAEALDHMGLPPVGTWFAMFDSYIYGNQNAVELVAGFRPLNARSVTELIAEIPQIRRRYQWLVDLPAEWMRDLDRYLLELGRLGSRPIEQMDVPTLWTHLVEINHAGRDYFRPNITISLAHTILHRVLLQLVATIRGAEQAPALVDALCGAPETRTALVNRDLHRLAQLAASDPELRQKLLAGEGHALLEGDHLAAYPAFAARFKRFLEDYGHRELDIDFYHPTWSGQPWVVLDQITSLLRAGTLTPPEEIETAQRERQFEAEQAFMQQVPAELRFFLHELIRLARTFTGLDDLEHFETTRLNVVARRAALELAARLHAAGIVDDPDDLFFFQRTDLERMIASFPRVESDDYRRRVAEARERYSRAQSKSPPWEWGRAVENSREHTGALRGIAGSPGTVTAPVFRVHSPADFGRVPPRSILVARTTNPAWTPLFYSAAGLITESGGPLSHGAVTARELGLPAVMAVRGAMSLFRDGQVVTVDGT